MKTERSQKQDQVIHNQAMLEAEATSIEPIIFKVIPVKSKHNYDEEGDDESDCVYEG